MQVCLTTQPAGTENTPPIVTDIVTLSQGDRGIIEFTPQNKGMMMFHSHVNEFSQGRLDGFIRGGMSNIFDGICRNKEF